ncbi:MAG TPA: acetamidase/formamidase family protein [Conexibacter sp.]|nr:acetamidase/formamidase family protein [Conexibacter sp.]
MDGEELQMTVQERALPRLGRDRGGEYDLVAREPKLVVKPGERFVVETEDALGGHLRSDDDLPTEASFGDALANEAFNACAGPIHVQGARPGDVLVVEIHDIRVADQGATCIFEGSGPLADSATYPDCRGPVTRIVRHLPGPSGTTSDGVGVFRDRVRWNLKPHIGTIALAPRRPLAAGADSNYGQGPQGGNIDVRDVCAGSRVWLPVAVEGACLYLGDVHASMGDGELTGVADESAADVTLSCELIPRKAIPFMRIETADAIVQVNSAKPLDDALADAYRWMIDWLVEDHGFSAQDAYILLGVHPDVRVNVYQFVKLGRLSFTVGVSFPRSAL